jgi:hypothetical protein
MNNDYRIVEAKYDKEIDAVAEYVIETFSEYWQAVKVFEQYANKGMAVCLDCDRAQDGISLAESKAYKEEYRLINA